MRVLTHEEYEAIKARRQRAYDEARARGVIAAARKPIDTAELVECVNDCDATYKALIAPMPTHVED